MKKVITAVDIRAARNAGQKCFAVPEGALVTPQAADDARDYGIALVRQAPGGTSAPEAAFGAASVPLRAPVAPLPTPAPAPSIRPPMPAPGVQASFSGAASVAPASASLEEEVRRQVLARLGASVDSARVGEAVRAVLSGGGSPASGGAPVQNAGGIVHVRKGDVPKAVPGASKGFAGVEMIETVIPAGVSSPGSGYLVFEKTSFEWTFPHTEILVLLEGELRLSSGGVTISAAPGDILHLPAGSSVTLSSSGKVCCACGSWPVSQK